LFSQICGELHQYTQIFLLFDSDPHTNIPASTLLSIARWETESADRISREPRPATSQARRAAARHYAKRMSIYDASDKFVPATVANAFHVFFEPLDIGALIILDNRAAWIRPIHSGKCR
jgi:hypothetical protein